MLAAFAIAGLLAGEDAGEQAAQAPGMAGAAGVSELSPGELTGQRLIAGWDGPEPAAGLRRLIARGSVSGVIVFADNYVSTPALRGTLRRLQRLRPDRDGPPLLTMVDQEGGLVARLPGPPAGSAAELSGRGPAYVRRQGERTAQLLRRHGLNVDLAPVLDLGAEEGAIASERRSFGADPAAVSELAVDGFAAGLREGGVAATAKHFPGLGAARVNTDEAAQRIDLPLETLRSEHERPFADFAAAGGELVMLSLATYPALADRPAAFAREIATGELREQVGFGGVSITDGLEAAAAQRFGSRAEVARAAVGAGADLLLYSDWQAARDVHRLLRRELAAGELDRAGFEQSAARVLALREGLDPAGE